MRNRALAAVLFVAAVVSTVGATAASADTLFTNSDYTARVGVGSATTATAGTVTLKAGSTVVDTCSSASLTVTLTQNDDTAVAGDLSNGSFNGCSLPIVGDYPWSFSVSGTPIRSPSSTVSQYTSASWTGVGLTYVDLWSDAGGGITFANTGYSGTLSSGVNVSQSAGDGGPVCLNLNNAGLLSGTSGTLTVSGAFCTAGTWSLGTTAKATLYTTTAHAATVAVGTSASLASSSAVTLVDPSTATPLETCGSSTLNAAVNRNTGGLVVAAINSGTFSSCSGVLLPATVITTPWTLKIGGSGLTTTSTRVFADTRLTHVGIGDTFFVNQYIGTLPAVVGSPTTNGVYATEPVAPGAPICLEMDRAGPLSGIVGLTGEYCFEGATASTWNLG